MSTGRRLPSWSRNLYSSGREQRDPGWQFTLKPRFPKTSATSSGTLWAANAARARPPTLGPLPLPCRSKSYLRQAEETAAG